MKRAKILWKRQTLMQEVPDEKLVTRDAMGEDDDDEDDERLDAGDETLPKRKCIAIYFK